MTRPRAPQDRIHDETKGTSKPAARAIGVILDKYDATWSHALWNVVHGLYDEGYRMHREPKK